MPAIRPCDGETDEDADDGLPGSLDTLATLDVLPIRLLPIRLPVRSVLVLVTVKPLSDADLVEELP